MKIIAAFRAAFPTYGTQSECVLAAHFHLAEHPQSAADQLAKMVKKAGNQLQTGFVGTLHDTCCMCSVITDMPSSPIRFCFCKRISVVALSGHQRGHYDLGTLGRHYGGWRLLECRYELL